MKNKKILVATLGYSWALVPEILGFTNPEQVKLFARRPGLEDICAELKPVDEIWLVTTEPTGKKTDHIDQLLQWKKLCPQAPDIKIWAPKSVNDLTDENKIRKMRELIWRVALKASESAGCENTFYCLAGGRKTMSADLQQAASIFGGRVLFHLLDNGNLPNHLHKPNPETLNRTLSAEESKMFSLAIFDHAIPRADILDFKGEHNGKNVDSERFPVKLAANNSKPLITTTFSDSLHATVLERKDRARHLLFHYAETLSKEPQGLPFQALNILAPTTIEKLKNTFIGKNKNKKIIQQEITWLKKLPKTELHCHLGGIANPGELIEIARAAENKLQKYNEKLANIVKRWQELVDAGKIKVLKRSLFKYKKEKRLKDVFLRLKRELKTPVWAICCSLILVFEKTPDLLTEFIYGNKINEKDFFSVGISEYEALGDLQGSSILQLEETIRKACQILIRKCIDHNVKYIEIRCSPGNYTRAGLTAEKVIKYISEEFEKARPTLFAGLIFIGSRHGKMSDLWRHVELAEDMLKNRKKITVPLVGFDLAGNEKFRADEFTSAFKPLFKRCMHITVHAGETQSAESIWQAVYSLHAERIGHGLKLNNNNYLRKHFLDRNISIELCPSSNFQIVGFKDNFLKSNKKTPIYPLKEYLNIGLEVCINTDNPGISRTDFSNEIHKAARLSPDGLSQWHILKLIKNGFSASFAPHAIRRKLLLEAERDILQFLK